MSQYWWVTAEHSGARLRRGQGWRGLRCALWRGLHGFGCSGKKSALGAFLASMTLARKIIMICPFRRQ